MASSDNAEYRVIQNRLELIARVSESILSVLAEKLSSNDLVSPVEHDNMKSDSCSPSERARDMMMNILKKLKEDNSVFYKFMSVLEDCKQENMVRFLESDLEKEKNKESECNQLRIENIPEICEAIYDASHLWHQIGIALTINNSTLKIIGIEEKGLDKCFLRMLMEWLMNGENTTWNALVDALRRPIVDAPGIADRLVDKISTSSHSSEKTLEKFPLIDTGTPNPRTEQLRMKDIRLICNALHDAREKWFILGIILRIDIFTLKAIELEEHGIDECFIRMLNYWLQAGKDTTWDALAAALRSTPLSCNRLAVEISTSSQSSEKSLEKGPLKESGIPYPRPELLRMKDLQHICNALHNVRVKWFMLGIMLQIGINTLKAIKVEGRGLDECLMRMLKYWLQAETDTTWDALAVCLRSKLIGHPDIAAAKIPRVEEDPATAAEMPRVEADSVLLEKKGDIEEAEEKIAKLSIHEGEGQEEKAGAEEVTIVKITYYPSKELGNGSYWTKVFKGRFEDRDVAVKRLLADGFSFADREVELLQKSDSHPGIIRYHCREQDKLYHYLALELADCTLYDYVKGEKKCRFTYSEVDAIKLLKQAIDGLSYLHKNEIGIVHRDIKPHNILLFSPEFKAKLSDFGLCKKLPPGSSSFSVHSGITGTFGWMAPEVYLNESERLSKSMDIFSMGCVIYFALSYGQHPFGSDLRRQVNIQDNIPDLSKLSKIKNYTALDLVKAMIRHDSHDRPTAEEVCCHCLFWLEKQQLQFFMEVHSYTMDKTSPAFNAIEEKASTVFKGDWKDLITSDDLKSELDKRGRYTGSLVKELIRFIRNMEAHFDEPTGLSQTIGWTREKFVQEINSYFPSLLVHSYNVMKTCKLT